MSAGLEIILIAVCMVGSAFFSGIETGVISIHRMKLRHFVREGMPGARILQSFLENTDRLLGTTLVGTNICVVVVSVVSASLAVDLVGAWGETLATVLTAIAVLVFCEYLPKAWFQTRPLERCGRFAGLLRLSEIIFRPISAGIVWLTRLFVGGSSREYPESVPFVTRDDLKILAREGEKEGILSPRERFMIHRVFELSGKTAGQIMIPRKDMTVVSRDTTLEGFFEIARQSNFTRLPVLEADSDSFVGVLNVFYILSKRSVAEGQAMGDFARPPLFVPEDMPVDDILPRMRRSRQPLCLVKNAQGQVTGLITTEDILEEIVGALN